MGIVIKKDDIANSKSYDEAEELARRRYRRNRNRVLYKNLRKYLNDARKESDIENYDQEMFWLKVVLYGVSRRIDELQRSGVR